MGSTFGSGIAGDGLMGVIDFSLDAGGNMSITSYAQDSYLETALDTPLFIDGKGVSGTSDASLMTGNIDGSGNVSFTPTGRQAGSFVMWCTMGDQPWNITPDDTVTTETAYDPFTTGTDTATKGKSSVTMTGAALQDAGAGSWTGIIVSAGNLNGQYLSGFDSALYTEQFNVTITANVVPVPAAVWLFGSGLIGLIGVARRKKS